MNEFWKNRNVFVTGGTGLLGSNLVKALVEKGANVTVLVRDGVHNSYFFMLGLDKRVNIVRGALQDYLLLERTINEYEIDTVFHLAAQAIVGTANRSPLSTFDSNIRGTWHVLEAARVSKLVKSVVVASSDKAYGSQKVLPYTEETPLQGEHPYDVSKSCTDLISLSFYKTYGLPVCVTRCGNLYGPGDLNWNRIIPGTIRSLYMNESPIIRSDGTFIRDYLYLADAVDAYLTIAENIEKCKGEAFNISTMNKINVLDLVRLTSSLYPSVIQPTVLNEVQGEIKDQYLSSEKIKNVLGWVPKHSIEEGLRGTIAWYREFLAKYG
ncbi:NAD-dependent epimerase/dehydratase family protein [archaeon]|jgi:CDP-glucose 4,6-dehydratase|nr:NAD-dependent epimerase/dehydratase family protein [archaeon]MBT4416959.1 NAD-dependent epimerase/dehydratase family protein [archaeon]